MRLRPAAFATRALTPLRAAGFYPNPVVPLPSCLVDPKDAGEAQAACDACKAAVKVKVGLPPRGRGGGGGGICARGEVSCVRVWRRRHRA